MLVGANLLAPAVRYRVLRGVLARPSAPPQEASAGDASGAPSPTSAAEQRHPAATELGSRRAARIVELGARGGGNPAGSGRGR